VATNKQRKQANKAKVQQATSVERKGRGKIVIPDRDSRAELVRQQIADKMKGRAELIPASEYSLPFLTKRIPSGLLSLDLELRGGFPAGGLSQVTGPASAGKNYLIACMARQLQYFLKEKTKILYALTEMRLDRSQLKRAGVRVAYNEADIVGMNEARIKQGFPPFTEEEITYLRDQVGEIDELHGDSAESLYDAILSAVNADVYHMIVIDSFGNIMSAAEAESESVGDKTYGGTSGVNSQFTRKLAAFLTMKDEYGRSRSTCVMGINQVREDMKNPDQFRNPGGRALQHATFVNLSVQSGKFLHNVEKVPAPGGGMKDHYNRWAKEVNWQIRKGKAGIHEGGSGTYLYDFRIDQADFYADTMVTGIQLEIVTQNGAYLGIRNPENPDAWLVYEQGRDNFKNALIEDDRVKGASGDPNTFMNLIRNQAFLKKGIAISYDWED
jgi:RecA/RadA recombinase